MKLFFDENLSERLPRHLTKEFPNSTHPRLCGLTGATDDVLVTYAKENGLIIVSRDEDIPMLVRFQGAPPKAIWLKLDNPSTRTVVHTLRLNLEQIEAFAVDATKDVLIIRQPIRGGD